MDYQPLFNIGFLASQFETEYQDYLQSGKDAATLQRLRAWAGRDLLNETASEAAFIRHFFHDLWDYKQQGSEDDKGVYHCYPQFPIANAGQGGGTGEADLALGVFSSDSAKIPQALCEFKDIKSNITESLDGKRLLRALTTLRATPDDHLRAALDTQLQSLATEIASAESAINADIYKLYGLTDEEIRLVEGG